MKKLSILLFLFISVNLFAQTPGAFSYQAIVRNASGDIVVSQEVAFQISILQDSDAGPSVYTERHSTTTNDYGLVNLQIGNGTLVSGSFGPDGWGETPHFIKVEFDPEGGDSFMELSTTQLLAVPYAFHAQTVENDKVNDADADPANEIQTLAISGNDLSISDGNTVILPEGATSPWSEDGDDIYINSGKVGIGTIPGGDLRKFQVIADDVQAIAAVNNSSYPAIFAQNNSGGRAAEFRGGIVIEDGTEGDGKVLTSDANGRASWETPETGNANMVPIAYGTVTSGTLRANSGNVSVSKNSTGIYSVSIDNEDYFYPDYITSLTMMGEPGFIEAGSVSGNLLVYTYDTSGASADASFHFVVYKP